MLLPVVAALVVFICWSVAYSHLYLRLLLAGRPGRLSQLFLSLRLLLQRGRVFYAFEDCLPGLPVPALRDSVNGYLATVAPLMPALTFAEHKLEVEVAAAQPFGLFAPLQRLLWLDSWRHRNWLSKLWLEYVYLQKRSPIAFFSNYYLLDSPNPAGLGVALRCCTHLRALQQLHLNQWNGQQRLAPFLLRSVVPYSTHNYKTCFATTRVPGDTTDVLRVFEKSRHVVVIRHREFFCFDLIEPGGEPVRPEQLLANLTYLWSLPAPERPACAVGVLTADERSSWSSNRARWFGTGLNKASLAAVESALFVVCLDEGAPRNNCEAAEAAFAGPAGSRWFDKSFCYVMWSNGRVGLNCEHAALDRHVPMHLMEVLLQSEADEQCVPSLDVRQRAQLQCQPRVKRLQWMVTPGLESAVSLACNAYAKHLADSNLFVFEFFGYGKAFVKQHCRASANSWLQMCLQLAFYRHRKRFVLTYESCELRYFAEGRTECIRPLSAESIQWCKLMQAEGSGREERVAALGAAMRVHGRRAREAERGRGFDRHLFGLFVLSVQQGQKGAQQVLSRMLSLPFDLSTHQHPIARHRGRASLDGGGCCASTKAGYAVGFVIKSDCVVMHIHSWRGAHVENSSRVFAQFIEQALLDMQDLYTH
jgi:hypothetical protein